MVINQTKTSVEFYDNRRVPFTTEQVATTAYNMIFLTGYLTNSCRHWNSKMSTNKTWKNFKQFFCWRAPNLARKPAVVGRRHLVLRKWTWFVRQTRLLTQSYFLTLQHQVTAKRIWTSWPPLPPSHMIYPRQTIILWRNYRKMSVCSASLENAG